MEAAYHENYLKQLERLLDSVVKSQKRYIEDSKHLESVELKNLFDKYAVERNDIIAELKKDIQSIGPKIHSISDVKIDQQNWDIPLPATNSHSDQSILAKARHTEQGTLDMYDEVLQGSVLEDLSLKTALMGQRLKINESFTEMDRQYFELFKKD